MTTSSPPGGAPGQGRWEEVVWPPWGELALGGTREQTWSLPPCRDRFCLQLRGASLKTSNAFFEKIHVSSLPAESSEKLPLHLE